MKRMRRFIGAVLAGVWIAGCTGSAAVRERSIARIDAAEALVRHGAQFEQTVIRVTDEIHVAVGFGLANAILIEGTDGAVIVDTLETMEQAKAVRAAFEKITRKPVKAIVYTHNHTDHVFGAAVWADTAPAVYAHRTTGHYIDRLVNQLRPIIGTRSMRMFGTYLDAAGRVNAGIGPFLGLRENSTVGLLRPTHTVDRALTITVAGIPMTLIHAPGETDDQIVIHLPRQGVLLCGDNFYASFPNLYTIRGTPFRSLSQWVESLDRMRELRPNHLVPSHGPPLTGSDTIYGVLTDYRDAIQFVHDQTIRGINQGLTPDELVAAVRLPPHLARAPYLGEYYGKVAWAVRAMFDGYLGWFDGNASSLHPLSPDAEAELIAGIAGGQSALMAHAAALSAEGRHQAVLQLTDHLLRLLPDDERVRTMRIDALVALGEKEANANARHYYLTEALEIRDRFLAAERAVPSPRTVHGFPLSGFFEALKVNLDPVAAAHVDRRVGFVFPDAGQSYTIHVRRGVAEVRPVLLPDPDILVTADGRLFKEMLARIRHPAVVLPRFTYETGNMIQLAAFLRLFEPRPQKLAVMPGIR